jgi:hypothetical protein
MPTKEQLTMLMRQRGSLTLAECQKYFHLNGGWVKPLNDTLNELIAAGEVHRDPYGGYLLIHKD